MTRTARTGGKLVRVIGRSGTELQLQAYDQTGTLQARTEFGNATLTTVGGASSALLHGLGNSTTRSVTGTSSAKFISYYTEANAASGYGNYYRHYISTASIDGDCFRIYSTVNNVAATTVRGLHCSLSFGTSGTVSGLGCAAEFTLHIANQATQAGTISPIKAAIHSDGATSDPSGSTLSYIQIVNQGNSTGDDDVDTDAYLMHVQGHAAGTGTLFQAVTTAYTLGEITHSLKCNVGGTVVHLLASTTGAQAT